MLNECDIDEFIIFFIKSRIEFDNKYKWFDAPFTQDCAECEKCLLVESAAIMFEEHNIAQLKDLLTNLIDYNQLTYTSYNYVNLIFYIFCTYFF